MTKHYDAERPRLGDTACLAIEQLNYLEALFSALAHQLDDLDPEGAKICDAKRLALLGRSHAEQWASLLDEINC